MWSKFLQGTLEQLNFAIKISNWLENCLLMTFMTRSLAGFIYAQDVRLNTSQMCDFKIKTQAAFKIHTSHLPVPWSMSKLKHNRDCQRQGPIEAIDQHTSSALMCVIFVLFDFTPRKNSIHSGQTFQLKWKDFYFLCPQFFFLLSASSSSAENVFSREVSC